MSSLTEFHDNLRQILEDTQKFLTVTLKSYKLKSDAVAQREAILEKMRDIHKERPNWLPELDDECEQEYEDFCEPNETSSTHDDSTVSHEGDGDSHSLDEGSYQPWAGSMEVTDAVAASSLTEAIRAGFLDKKRKQETGLSFLQPYQKRWCVIKNNTFYYYASPKDKKQKGAFVVDEYEARPCVTSRKDCGFELVCPGHRTYIFSTCSPEECTAWIDAVASVSKMTSELSKRPVDADVDDEDGEDYVDPAEAIEYIEPESAPGPHSPLARGLMGDSKKKGKKDLPPIPIEEEIYDDGETVPSETIEEDIYYNPDEELAQRPRSQTPVEEIIEEEIYDDTDEIRPDVPPELPSTPRPSKPIIFPSSPPAVEEIIEEEIYDDTDTIDQPPEVPSTPRPSAKESPYLAHPRELPPDPTAKKTEEKMPDRETDLENLYLAMWDCAAAETNELSFKRGDIIHVVGHEYEKYDWLTGELGGNIGLVPKNHLMRAYERIQ